MAQVKQLEGRDHYVVPMVMLTVGSHSGSNGPVYYPAEELSRSASDWNGRPVVVYHPQLNGRGVSAGDPDITNRYKVGTIFNTSFDGHRLKADAWIDVARVQQVDSRVADAIAFNKQMEVSTGLVLDVDEVNTNAGSPIARNYRPDHLALLPDKTGACSLAAGCGLMRNEGLVMVVEDEPLLLPTF